MGVIEKSIRKRSNQKLAAEAFTPTRLSFDEVVAAVQKICDESNAAVTSHIESAQANARTRLGKWTTSLNDPKKSHYYVSPRPEMRQVLIGFGQRPEPIMAGRGNTHAGVWAARVSYPAGGHTVGMALLKWVINGDGVLRHRSFYESLLESVHAAISSDAPESDGAGQEPGRYDPTASSGAAQPEPEAAPGTGMADTSAAAPPGPSPAEAHPARAPAAPQPQQQSLVEPLHTKAGDWINDVASQFPFLTRNEITGLAGLRALLAVDTGYHASSYLTGQITASQMYGSLTHSLLRANVIQHSGATVLTCGVPKPDLNFAHDWQLKYTVGEDGTAVIEVPQYRHGNNEVRGAQLLASMREAVAENLASGVHLHLGEGVPQTAGLVVSMPAGAPGYPDDDESPFRRDFLGGVPADGCEPLSLPAHARDMVMDAMLRSHFRTSLGQGDDLCVASLAGGRPFDSGSVVFRRAGEGDQLVICLPASLPPAELERSYRVALRCLERIALNLQEADPGLCTTIGEHVSRLAGVTQKAWSSASGTRLKDRPPGLWTENWNKATPALMVPVAASRWYPVGVLAVSPEQANYVSRMAQAADWVSTFKRVKPILNANGRPTSRHTFTSRRSGLLHNASDQALPYLRFAANEVIWDHRLKGVSASQAWFWEVNARSATELGPSGVPGGLLLTTGWSHADGVLGYGENLLALFRAFADVVTATDPHAQIHTLYLAT
jgi:hypothetical protein